MLIKSESSLAFGISNLTFRLHIHTREIPYAI